MEVQGNQIKNIIFDLGGVILDIDMQLTIEALNSIGAENLLKNYGVSGQKELAYRLEIGSIDAGEFRDLIRKGAEADIPDDDIDEAWNALLLHFKEERIEVLQRLKGQYRIFLLSNTNIIHQECFFSRFRMKFGQEFSELFENDYYSHEMGLNKPNPEIFQLVIEENNLNPQETLFLDDSQANLSGAELVGLNTILVTPENPIEKIFVEE